MRMISRILLIASLAFVFTGCSNGSLATSSGTGSVKRVTRNIQGIPVLEMYQQNPAKKPLILISHGFGGNKERMNKKNLMKRLAEMGYYVVALDNRMHGERTGAKFSYVKVFLRGKIDFLEVRKAIKETADDVTTPIDYYSNEESIDQNRIGMMGFSMGGFITYRALAIDDRIKVALPFISSPFWDDMPGNLPKRIKIELNEADFKQYCDEFSPGTQLDKFYPRAILGQVGQDDVHFRVDRVEEFYKQLAPYYKEDPEKLKLIVVPDTKHEVTDEMFHNALAWLEKYL